MLKKLTLALVCVGILSSAVADTATFVIPPNTQTNIFPAPVKLLSLSVLATNACTVLMYDAPGTATTWSATAYTNYTQYATNVSQIYTNFFGVATTNWLTNALVRYTNSVAASTNNYQQVFAQSYASNTTTTIPNLGITFVNGVLLTNAANTLTITVSYTGN